MLTESQQIEAIYSAYPRHIGKRAAVRAIENAVRRIVKDQPIDAVAARRILFTKAANYSLSPAGQKPPDPEHDFRPHPATWFNQERYLDDRSEWQKPNGGNGNGKQQTGTKATRTIDSARAAIERIEDRHRSCPTGNDEGRGVQPDDSGDICGRTIEGTV